MKRQGLYSQYRKALPSSFLLSSDEDEHLKQKIRVATEIDWCIKCRHPYLILRQESVGSRFCIMCGEQGAWHSCKIGGGHKSDPLATLVWSQSDV